MPTDGIDRLTAFTETAFETFQFDMKRSEIAEISIRHTKANSFQKSGAKF
jgi:hypothetical protein